MPLFMTGVQYHLSCSSCGKDWWCPEAFPKYCPFCMTNREPKIIGKFETPKITD